MRVLEARAGVRPAILIVVALTLVFGCGVVGCGARVAERSRGADAGASERAAPLLIHAPPSAQEPPRIGEPGDLDGGALEGEIGEPAYYDAGAPAEEPPRLGEPVFLDGG